MSITNPLDISGHRVIVSAAHQGGNSYASGAQMTGTWEDWSGNDRHLTAVAGTGGSKPLWYADGVLFTSGNMDKVGGYFTIPASVFTGLTSATVIAVLESDQPRTTHWELGAAGQNGHWPFDDAGYENAFVTTRSSFLAQLSTGPPGPLNIPRRYMVTMSAGAGRQKAYLENAQQNDSGRTFALPTAPKLGGGAAYNLAGRVMYFAVVDHVLTTTEAADYDEWLAANMDGGGPVSAPGTPTGLTADPDGTTVDLDWTASSGTVTGYRVRLDGGTPTDVGNVLAETLTGLSYATAYTAEVQAYGPGGDSAWASVGFTTDDPPPTPEGYYRVELVAGPYSWTVTDTDVPDYGPIAGFRFGWQVSENAPQPAQQPVPTATFGLVVAAAADVADLDVGSPVAIRVWLNTYDTDPAACDWSFYGRVADMESEPRSQGLLVAINAVGYLADLGEYLVTDPDLGADLLGLAGWAASYAPSYSGFYPASPVLASATGTVLDQLLTLYATHFVDRFGTHLYAERLSPPYSYPLGERSWAAYMAHPYATDTGVGRADGLQLAVDPLDSYFQARDHQLPGVLDLAGGLVVVTIPEDPGSGVVSGDLVEFDTVRWRKGKEDRADAVTVSWSDGTDSFAYTYTNPYPTHPQVVQPITLPEPEPEMGGGPGLVGRYYLPPAAESSKWATDRLRVHLWAQPDALPLVIPNAADHADGGAEDRTVLRVRPIVVVDVPPEHNPTTAPWIAGQLVGAEFVMDAAPAHRFYVDLTLNRTIARSAAHYRGYPPTAPSSPEDRGYLAWEDLDTSPTFTGLAWSDLDPAFTWIDYRLVRSPADA